MACERCEGIHRKGEKVCYCHCHDKIGHQPWYPQVPRWQEGLHRQRFS